MNTIQHKHTDAFIQSLPHVFFERRIVLDHGCGDCYASDRFRDLGAREVDSYDIAPQYSTSEVLGRDAILTDGYYDIVWSHHVVEHQADPVDYLSGLWDLLKDGGTLLLGCPNTAGISVFADGHLCNFTIGNLVLCLQRTPFNMLTLGWFLTKGQIRIRINKSCLMNHELPEPFVQAFAKDKHFDVTKLPQKWNW